MIGAFTLAVFLVMLGMVYCGWRAWSLLTRWRPAAAFVWSSDYSEAQVADDRFGWGTLRDWNLRDGEDGRFIDELVQFEDADGVTHRAQVSRTVTRGLSPDGAYVIWYDPADPQRATAFGPGGWTMAAFALGVAAVIVVRAAMRMVH